MTRPYVRYFYVGNERRELRNPDGPPSGRQLLALNAAGALELVWPGTVPPISKAEAAGGVDRAIERGYLERPDSPKRREERDA